jgi:Na+/H+ antiporter NhaD/arsenite permease-like protein
VLTAAIIFVATYVVVALGYFPGLRLDRTGAAVVGAAFMVAFHVITPERAFASIDMATLVLLFGMMVIVGNLRLAGFFRWAGAAVARRATTPRRLLAGLILVTGVLSALFVNDTICLALTPLVIEVTGVLEVRATPYSRWASASFGCDSTASASAGCPPSSCLLSGGNGQGGSSRPGRVVAAAICRRRL